MRKTFTYLSLLIAFMFAGTMSGWAQFSGRAEQYPTTEYELSEIKFSLTEVATALETDTTTLVAALDAWFAGEEGVTNMMSLLQPDETKSENYTQGSPGGFWMTSESAVTGWGESSTWYNQVSWDATEDAFYFWVGQYPAAMVAGDATSATFFLSYNGKEVTFNVGLDVVALPEYPEPTTTKLSELNIVGEWTLELPFYLGKSFEGLTYSTTLDGIYDALGVSQAALDANVANYVYSYVIKADTLKNEEGIATGEIAYTLSDDLAQPIPTTDGWFGRYSNYDEATATDLPLPVNALMAWGNTNLTFYVQGMSLANGEYSVRAGQYGDAFTTLEQSDSTHHYIIAGDKAAKIKIVVKMQEQETLPLTEMTQVGEETIEIQHYIGGSVGSFTLDLANLEALLGAGAINFEVLADESGTALSSNTTANKGGYWMTKEGYPIKWGTEGYAIYVEPKTQGDFSAFEYGFNDGAWTLGDKATVKLYFHNGTQYYIVNLNVEIIEQPQISEDEFEVVATEGVHFQIIPSSAYTEDYMKTDLDIEYLTSLLGEGTYKLYGMSVPNADGVSTMTDAYSCTPYPGFWMTTDTPEAYVGNHGTNSFGMTYANGVITWYQIPNLRAAGDIYNATFFLLNESNNKMVKLAVVIEYVDAIVETEVVGEEDLTLVVADGEDPLYTPIDLTAVTEAFGVDVDLLEAASEIKVLKTPTSFTADNNDSYYGWFLNESGCCVDLTNEEATMTAPVTLGYEWYNTEDAPLSFFTTSGVMAVAPADGVVYRTKMAIEYDAKRYIYNISLMNQATATGIEKVETSTAKAGNVYDLTGRIVRKSATNVNGLANGIYILNGKKYIVK